MSVPNQIPYNIYTANGLTTVFAYEFYLISASDIQVTINGSEVTSGYTVSGVGNTNGGEVTFLTAPANGATVIFERVTPTYRLTDYQDNGDLLADTVNKDFDRLWMAIQRAFIYLGVALTRPLFGGGPFDANGYRITNLADPINDQDAATKKFVVEHGEVNLNRTLRVPESKIPAIPATHSRKNKILAFNDQGNPIAVLPESGSAADVLIQLASSDPDKGADLVNSKYRYTVADYLYPKPEDFFVGAFFDNGKNKTIYLASSPDGVTFYRLNTNPLAGTNAATTGRDPSILYFNGYWYIAYTGSQNLGNIGDFTIMRSRDMITWKSYPVKAYGNEVIYKKPGSVLGGGISVIKDVWGPSLYVAEKELYAVLIVSYNDDTTDINGSKIGWQVPISLRCNDLENLVFDLPELLLTNQDVPRLDTEVNYIDGRYYAAVKNEYNKKIELWASDFPASGFVQINTIDFGLNVEGPSIVFNNSQKLWFMYVDAYELQGVYYYSTSPDLTTWSLAKKIVSPFQMRHGSILNLANVENPVSAIESFKTSSALQHAQGVMQQLKIASVQYLTENISLEPEQDKLYSVLGSTDVTLTVPTNYRPHECTVFYVYKASQASTGGITVTGPMINGTFKIGYSDSNQTLFAFVLDPSSKRYNCMGIPSFDTLRNRNNTWTKTNIFNGTVDVDQFINIGQSNVATGVRRLGFYALGDGTVSAYVQGSSTGELTLQGNNGIGSAGNLYPTTSAAMYRLGKNTNLWSAVYAQNSAISTSDAREKTSPKDITADEVSAFYKIGQLPWVWQWLSRYQTEGDNARLHAGPTVQAAIEIMTEHGLNWRNYAAFCYDEWDALDGIWDEWPAEYEIIQAQPAIVDNGVVNSEEVPERSVLIREAGRILVQEGRLAGNRYSFRKEELLLWVLRATISKFKDIESRLSAIESLV